MDYKKKLEEVKLKKELQQKANDLKAAIATKAMPESILPPEDVMDAAEYLVRQKIEQGNDYVTAYSAIKLVFKLSEEVAQAIVDKVRNEGTPQWTESFVFFAKSGNKTSIQMDERAFWVMLEKRNFRKHQPGDVREGYILVQVVENVIYERNIGNIKDVIMDYIQNLPVQVAVNGESIYRSEIQRLIYRNEKSLFTMSKVELLPPLFTGIPGLNLGIFKRNKWAGLLKDTTKSAYLVYLNGWVEITADAKIEIHPLKTLPGLVWEEELIKRNLTITEFKDSMSAKFIDLISSKDPLRFKALKSAIGYLMHRHKDRSINKAVILMDEQVSTEPNGGTGKSMIGQMLKKVRGTMWIDGRSFKWDKSFLFQRYRPWHSVINFDDVEAWFDFGKCYVMLTEGVTVERKGRDEVMTDYADSPKLLISTNYVVQGNGQSNERRRIDFEIAPHFNANHQPKDEFGKKFFEDWSAQEWAQFDSFMIDCCRLYMKEGLLQPPGQNRALRMLIQVTAPEFPDWMDSYFTELRKYQANEVSVGKKEMYQEWISYIGWSDKDLSEKKWKKWLDSYARYSGITIAEERVGNIGARERKWVFTFPSVSSIGVQDVQHCKSGVTHSESEDDLPF